MNNKQLAGLAKASIKKKAEALIKTEEAITRLIDKQQKITIRSVAKEAKVSVSYIYKYPELAYKIQRLREQQKYSPIVSNQPAKKANQNIEAWQIEQAELKQEIAELKVIIEQAKKENNLKKLQIENLQLATENFRLKQELDYTLQSLQEAREFILEQRQLNSEW